LHRNVKNYVITVAEAAICRILRKWS